jgi:hypothetical protein
MFSLKFLMLLLCVWGIDAIATVRVEGEQDSEEAKTLKSWVAQLGKQIAAKRVRSNSSEGMQNDRTPIRKAEVTGKKLPRFARHWSGLNLKQRPLLTLACSYSSCAGKMTQTTTM